MGFSKHIYDHASAQQQRILKASRAAGVIPFQSFGFLAIS
jgi:hypothetical protein